eukprot:g22237.t1
MCLVVGMASNGPLDVDAGGIVGEDKGDPIVVWEGREGVRAKVRKMGQTWLTALSTTVLGNPWLRKKMDIYDSCNGNRNWEEGMESLQER